MYLTEYEYHALQARSCNDAEAHDNLDRDETEGPERRKRRGAAVRSMEATRQHFRKEAQERLLCMPRCCTCNVAMVLALTKLQNSRSAGREECRRAHKAALAAPEC